MGDFSICFSEHLTGHPNNFISFIDNMLCSSKTNVTTGGSNGCADQLTNWDGTQKIGLGLCQRRNVECHSSYVLT